MMHINSIYKKKNRIKPYNSILMHQQKINRIANTIIKMKAQREKEMCIRRLKICTRLISRIYNSI